MEANIMHVDRLDDQSLKKLREEAGVPDFIKARFEFDAVWWWTELPSKDKAEKDPLGKWGVKQTAINWGKAHGHTVFIERKIENPRDPDHDYRQFGSYLSLERFEHAIGRQDLVMLEVAPTGEPVKPYLDFDQKPDLPGDINDCIRMLKEGHLVCFGIELHSEDIFITAAHGVAEEGKWEGQAKQSNHLVVNNGMHFANTRDCKAFIKRVFPGGRLDVTPDDVKKGPVDLVPYAANQSFKTIYQSKTAGSRERVNMPITGSWEEHMITHIPAGSVVYDMTKLLSAGKQKAGAPPGKHVPKLGKPRRQPQAKESGWTPNVPLADAISLAQETISTHRVCRDTLSTFRQVYDGDALYFETHGARTCPCGDTHMSNNFLLRFRADGCLVYVCFGAACPPLVVGHWKHLANTPMLEDVNPQSVSSLLQYLQTPGRDDDGDLMFRVACICRNERVQFEAFDSWCRKNPDFDPTAARSVWSAAANRPAGGHAYDIHTLQGLVKQENPYIMQAARDQWINQCINITLDLASLGVRYVRYDERYVLPLAEEWGKASHILLRSAMKTGKTTTATKAIQTLPHKSALIITNRKTLSWSCMGSDGYLKAFPGLKHYLDQSNAFMFEWDYVVVQLESLCRVGERFDVVVLDECESLLQQFSSSTMHRLAETWERFQQVVRAAKWCLWADAFLQDRSIAICLAILGTPESMVVIENTHQPTNRQATQVGWDRTAKDGMMNTLQALSGDRNYFVSASRKFLEESEHLLPQPRLSITSKTPGIAKDLADATTLFGKFQNVCATGALTTGVNCAVQGHFDNVVLFFSAAKGMLVRDMMQASLRVRELTKERLFYGVYPRYHETKAFNVYNREALGDIIAGRVELERQLAKDEAADQLWDLRDELDPILQQLWVYNQQELNVSAFFHGQMVQRYLKVCGYQHKDEELSAELVDQATDLANTLPGSATPAYDDIPDIDRNEFICIANKIKRCIASELKKLMFLKHISDRYNLRQDRLAPLDVRRRLFEQYVKDPDSLKDRLRNIRAEHRGGVKGVSSAFQDNRTGKLHLIQQVCKALGIQHTQEVGVNIEAETMQEACRWVLAHKSELQGAFGLRQREKEVEASEGSTKDFAVKRGLDILNAALLLWGFTKVCKAKTRIRKNKVDVTPYTVLPQGTSGDKLAYYEQCVEWLNIHPREAKVPETVSSDLV